MRPLLLVLALSVSAACVTPPRTDAPQPCAEAAPWTAFGRAVAQQSATLVERTDEGRELYVARIGGTQDRWFAATGFNGWTSGAVTVFNEPRDWRNERLRRHERAHYLQACRYGATLPVRYYGASVAQAFTGGHPYRDNPLEIEARAAEDDAP